MSPRKTFSGFTPVDVEMQSPTVVSHLQSSHQKYPVLLPQTSWKMSPCLVKTLRPTVVSGIVKNIGKCFFVLFFFNTKSNLISRGFEKQSQTAHISSFVATKLSEKWKYSVVSCLLDRCLQHKSGSCLVKNTQTGRKTARGFTLTNVAMWFECDVIIVDFECRESGFFVPSLQATDRSSGGSWFCSRSSHCDCICILPLCRTPLTSANDFTSTKSKIIQLCLELTSTVQKVSEAHT